MLDYDISEEEMAHWKSGLEMPNPIPVFDSQYNIILMIQVKNFEGPVREDVRDIAKSALEDTGIEEHYFGVCFGRFNYSVEFCHSSAKIASDIVCNLENNLVTSLRKKWRKASVCSSMVIGTEIICSSKLPNRYDQASRACVFIRPHNGKISHLAETVKTLNFLEPIRTQIKLLWTHGVHWVLLFSGPCLDGILAKLDIFRRKAEGHYIETSTCVSLNYQESFFEGQDNTNPKHKHLPKYAMTLIKQSKTGSLELGGLRPLKLIPSLPVQIKRLGGSDTILIFKEATINEIMSNIRDLRGMNWNRILHTATVLIYGDGNEKGQ